MFRADLLVRKEGLARAVNLEEILLMQHPIESDGWNADDETSIP
jgi:hypothetical protein